ncbi:hypothetical protein Hanom_Chr02g00118081 [Helianthus anomalus]
MLTFKNDMWAILHSGKFRIACRHWKNCLLVGKESICLCPCSDPNTTLDPIVSDPT